MTKRPEINKGNPLYCPGKVLNYLEFFAISFEPEMLESRSRVQKTSCDSLVSNKTLSHKIG